MGVKVRVRAGGRLKAEVSSVEAQAPSREAQGSCMAGARRFPALVTWYLILVRLSLLTTDYTDSTDMADVVHEKQSREIIGAAMTMLNELKPGLS